MSENELQQIKDLSSLGNTIVYKDYCVVPSAYYALFSGKDVNYINRSIKRLEE